VDASLTLKVELNERDLRNFFPAFCLFVINAMVSGVGRCDVSTGAIDL
jgi:hypothetical protein